MNPRGQSVIIVLWIMGLASMAIGGVMVRSAHDLRLGQMPLQRLEQRAVAHGAVPYAVTLLRRDDPALDHLQETWATGVDVPTQEQLLLNVPLGTGAFSIGVRDGQVLRLGLIDEERKLNLNVAEAQQLRRLIELVGPGDADPQAVADAIVDWRQPSDPEGPVCAGRMPPCHNGPLDSVEELRLVPGVSAQLAQALEPYVTVLTTGVVNVNTAPAEVLNALGCPGEAWVAQRDHEPFTASPDAGHPMLTVTSNVFSLTVEAITPQASDPYRLRVVVSRQGRILAWQPL